MAVAIATVTTPTFEGNGSGENITITHPASLAAGDLMIACLAEVDADNNATPAEPTATGWTTLRTQTIETTNPGPARLTVLYKVADSGDVSAGNTTFSLGIGGSNDVWVGGSIYRITGHGDIANILSAIGTSSGTSPSYTGLTPGFADSLYLMFIMQVTGSSGATSAYAIATNNPSWTERFDTYADSSGYGGGDDLVFAGATASRPEVTATGNFSATTNNNESIGALIIIPPVTNVTPAPAVISAIASVIDPSSVTGGAVVSPSVISSLVTVQAPVIVTGEPTWAYPTKPSPSWDYPTKTP